MESVNNENKQIQKIDRVVLNIESIATIQRISEQVQNELGDLVQISQKDIVNFLIQERSADLSAMEIAKIKNEHFDIVRALKRATQEAIRAKQGGQEIQMDELLKIIQTPGVIKTKVPKNLRGRCKKTGGEPVTHGENGEAKGANEQPESVLKRVSKINLPNSKSEDLCNNNIPVAT